MLGVKLHVAAYVVIICSQREFKKTREMATLLPGYFLTLVSDASKARYREKIQLASGFDPYEV